MIRSALDPQLWPRLRLFIFDLDGTLIDSKLDLALSVNATRGEFALPPLPHEQIFGYIGQGAPMLIRRSLDHTADDELVERALAFFLAYYREHMLDNTVAYPGVQEGLEQLVGGSRILTVLTNKPERFSRAILAGLGLAGYFRAIYGGNSFERKKPDPMGVEVLLGETGVGKEQAMVVGDSEIDVLTARNAAVWVCGVNYGLGSHLLDEYPPDLRVDSLTELAALVAGPTGEKPEPPNLPGHPK
ncbi:MAG: HAD hydrolase-like protein [Acidobacteria bacterium]|nr:HAD hydrolase-like protein [Acidobacteriota bacterium]